MTLSDGGNSTQTMVTGGGAAVRFGALLAARAISSGDRACRAPCVPPCPAPPPLRPAPTPPAQLFKTSEAKAFSIVRIKEYQLNYLAARKIFIIVDFDVIEQSFSQIGMPVMLGAAPPADDMGGGVPVGGAGGAPAYGAGAPAAAAYAGAGAVVRAAPAQGAQACMPIAQLNPYVNRWNIKVRVLTKGEIRTWDKPNSSGKLFKVRRRGVGCVWGGGCALYLALYLLGSASRLGPPHPMPILNHP